MNVYTAFVRYPLSGLSGRPRQDVRYVSPVPLLGSAFLVVGLLLLGPSGWVLYLGMAIAIVDPGAVHRAGVVLLVDVARGARAAADR